MTLGAKSNSGSRRIYRRNSNVVSREILGERILVPISRQSSDIGQMYLLNEVAAYCWNLFDGEKSLEQIASMVVTAYQVTIEVAESDLSDLANRLSAIGALEEVELELPTDTREGLL